MSTASTSTASTSTASTTTHAAAPRVRPLTVGRTLGGRAAVAYGLLAMGVGAAQAVRSGDTAVQIATGMRWILVVFSVSLLVVVVAHLGLARYARSAWGAVVAAVGTPLLAVGAMSSAVNGSDLSWFPVVAVVANGLWLTGSVMLGLSLWRARRVPRWIAVLLPLSMPVTLVLSQLGSGLVVGLFWVVVGTKMLAGRFGRA